MALSQESLEVYSASCRSIASMKLRVQLLLVMLALFSSNLEARAQGTAFTYQGLLNDNGTIANGTYDLSFSLFDADTGGSPVVTPLTNSAVTVNNGQYTVLLDFGPGIFTGTNYWLEL